MARKKAQPKHYPSQTKPTVQTVTNPDRWDRTHGTYLSGRAAIDGADAIAVEMEAYWGVDRLRLLVPSELREKFDRQRYLFNAAIQNGDLEVVKTQSARMITAYMVLNQTAIKAGAKRLDPQVMEVAGPGGAVIAIVPDVQRASLVRADGRQVAVFTVEEIAYLVSQITGVAQAKVKFPGAAVTRVESKGDPLKGIDRPDGFDTPFDDGVPNLAGR